MMPPPGIATCVIGGPEDGVVGEVGVVTGTPRPTPGDGRPLPVGISLRIFRCSHPLRVPDCTRHNPSRLVCTTADRMAREERGRGLYAEWRATATLYSYARTSNRILYQLVESAAVGG